MTKETECLDSGSPGSLGVEAGRGRVSAAGMKAREGFPSLGGGVGRGLPSSAPAKHAIHTAAQSSRACTHVACLEADGAPAGQGMPPSSAPVPRQLQCSKSVTVTKEAREGSLPTHAHQLGGHIRTRWATDKLTSAPIHAPQPLHTRKVRREEKNKKKKEPAKSPLPTWSPSAPLLGAEEFDPGKDV